MKQPSKDYISFICRLYGDHYDDQEEVRSSGRAANDVVIFDYECFFIWKGQRRHCQICLSSYWMNQERRYWRHQRSDHPNCSSEGIVAV